MEREKLLQELPENFSVDLEISDELLELVVRQYKLLQEYNEGKYLPHNRVTLTTDGKLFLPEGTLIHGVRKSPTKEYLDSVSKKGLIAPEFLGEYEDTETFYCIDFYRVPSEYSMEDYYSWYTELDTSTGLRKPKPEKNFLPWYNDVGDNESIAFVVNNSPDLYRFLQYDYYRENENYEIMQQVVNLGIVSTYKEKMQDRLSCVLTGVPSYAISGILITERLANNEEFMENLKQAFPNSYVALANDGTIVYMPPYISIEEQNRISL